MALTTRTLPALMNGISRQPAILRSPDQTEDELNTWGDIARGVSRRPPTRTIRHLDGLAPSDASVHHINRDVNERYFVVIDHNSIRVFDEATGLERTVNYPAGKAYLYAQGPDYRAVTIADYTFIVNTKQPVGTLPVGADEAAPDANLRWLGGTSPRKLNSTAVVNYAGDPIQYLPNPPSSSLAGTVPSMDKLPDPPVDGAIYKVLGQNSSSFVSYYVRGDGAVWDETVAPGLVNALDPVTMPHALVREADGTFTFAPFSWQPRRVGDEETNPLPPFVGRTIRDVFFYQNRLGLLSDESVIFSGAGDYGDFFRLTVLDYIDSDALAASATTTDVAILEWAVPFADGVMLFSRQRQLSLTNGDSGLSAHSLAIQPVTSYPISPLVKPTPMGSQVHFVTDSSGQASVQEYTRLAGADPTEAADITAHVPGLLPQGASQLIPAHDINALFVLTHAAEAEKRTQMYAYQFFWDGDKKLQSAWRVWDFTDGQPVAGAYESGSLFLLMQRGSDYFIERMDLSPSAVSENQSHHIYLDRQEAITGTYDAATNTTTFTASFTLDPDAVRIVRGLGAAAPEGAISPSTYTVSGATITVPGDESAAAATVGHLFTTKLVPSQQYAQDWQGHLLTSGRLVLHTFTVNMTDTAYTRAEVYPYGADANTLNPGVLSVETFTGKHVGLLDSIIGDQGYFTGPFMFSVAGNSQVARIELINDSPFGSTWTSAEWEGLFFSRAL